MIFVKVKTVLSERINFAFICLAFILRYHKPLLPGRHVPTSQLRNYIEFKAHTLLGRDTVWLGRISEKTLILTHLRRLSLSFFI